MKRIMLSVLFACILIAAYFPVALGETMLMQGDTFTEGGVRYQVYIDQEQGKTLVPAEFLQPDIVYSFNVRGLTVSIPWDYFQLDCMRNKEIFETITFADGTRTIPANACAYMQNLTAVVLPPSVQEIQNYAFQECERLTSINFPEGLLTIEHNAFNNCTSLADVQLPGTLKSIEANVFHNITITDLVLPEGMISIESYAFSGMRFLKNITIPSTVAFIGDSAFVRHLRLDETPDETEIHLSANNPYYTLSDGCLYSYNKEKLLYVTPQFTGAFHVPAGVVAIADNAFDECSWISELTLPEGVKDLPYSIGNMQGLKRIFLPSTMALAEETTLGNTSSLEWIEIAHGNSSAQSIDGIMFSADGKTLLQYPPGRTGSFTVPDTVQYIGHRAFSNSRLSGLVFGDSMPMDESIFGYECAIESVTIGTGFSPSITPGVLRSMQNLQEITVTESNPWFTSIDGVLFTADGLTLVKYPGGRTGPYTPPNGTRTIGEYAFYSCMLDEITLPEGIRDLMDYAFFHVSAKIHLPASLASLSQYALYETKDVQYSIAPAHAFMRTEGQFILYEDELFHAFGQFGEAVIFPPGISKIPSNILNDNNAAEVRTVVIPEGVTVIEDHAFGGMTRLTNVSLPFSLLEIGESAFIECVSLEKILLPQRLEKIGNYAFAGCQRLSGITIPDAVYEIGFYTFKHAGFGFMNEWDEYNPTPTAFIITGANHEIIRWAAYNNQCLWHDNTVPDATPIRVASLLPLDVLYAAVLSVDTASAGVDLYGDPSCRSKTGNVPNGTPVYAVGEENGVVRFKFIDTNTYGYVPKTSTVRVEDLAGTYAPIYTKLKHQQTMPTSFTVYTYPRADASTFSVPYVDSAYMRILANLGTWFKVATQDGQIGYMPTNQVFTFYDYIGEDHDPYRWVTLHVVTNPNAVDRLNLRESPDRNSASLGKYFNGTVVEVLDTQGAWTQVYTPDGKTGWMMTEFLYGTAMWPGNLLGTYEGDG